jgi:carbonic anhydrase
MDFRLHPKVEEALRMQGLSFDPFTPAGAVKNLVNPENENDREFVLRQIAKSSKLHHIKKVILINHTDCGAYGGSAAFENDQVEERKHTEDLKSAAKIVKERFTELEVELFLAHLLPTEKDWQINLEKISNI